MLLHNYMVNVGLPVIVPIVTIFNFISLAIELPEGCHVLGTSVPNTWTGTENIT